MLAIWFIVSTVIGIAYFVEIGRASRCIMKKENTWILPLLPNLFSGLSNGIRWRALAYLVISLSLAIAYTQIT